MPSNNPLEVLQSLNWDEPVMPSDSRFVDTDAARGEHIQHRLMRKFGYDRASNKLFAAAKKHVLLFGPIGCGKSTELLRFHATLRTTQVLYPITLNLRNEVDINNLQYADMLMALATAVVQELATKNIAIPPKELDKLSNWFKEHVQTQEDIKELSAEIHSEISAEVGIPFLAKLMSRLTGKFKNSSSYKDALRKVVRNSFTQFVTAFNALILAAEESIVARGLGQRLLLIVDGTDKITLDDAQRLFVADTEQLIAIEALVLYTAPISLKYAGATHSKLDTDIVLPIIMAPEDYVFLAATDHAKGELVGMDQRSSNLLWRLALLQYNNGSWRLSHPLVRRLAEYKKALAAAQAGATTAGTSAATAAATAAPTPAPATI